MPAPYRNVEKCKEYIHCMSNFFLSDEHKNEAMQQQRELNHYRHTVQRK